MAGSSAHMKTGDTGPPIESTLLDSVKAPVNLAGASALFKMKRDADGELVVNGTATITDAANGVLEYPWVPSDTAIAGKFKAEWEVTFASGQVQTFPRPGYIIVSITSDLDA